MAGGLKRLALNLGTMSSASAVAMVISLVTTPILTRVFDPEAYGTFALTNQAATFLAALVLLALPSGFATTPRLITRIRLQVTLAVLMMIGVCLTSVVVVLLWLGGEIASAVLLLPVLLLALMLQQIAQGWAVAFDAFQRLATARVGHPVLSRSLAIAMGFISGGHGAWLVSGEALGYLLQYRVGAGEGTLRALKRLWRFRRRLVRTVARTVIRFRDFATYFYVIGLLQVGVLLGQVSLIALGYSVAGAGHYSMAMGIATLPIQLVSFATASVFYREFIRTRESQPLRLRRDVLLVIGGFVLAGLIPYGVLAEWGGPLFAFVLGAGWQVSGELAAIMAFALLAEFAYVPVSSVFRVVESVRVQFWLELVHGAAVLGVLGFFAGGVPLATLLGWVAIIMIVSRSVGITAVVLVSRP